MLNGGVVAATAGGAAAAAANAIKAAGAIVKVESEAFMLMVNKCEKPLVVVAQSKFFSTTFRYMTNYRGFFFVTKTSTLLNLPGKAEIVAAKTIWIPA